MEAGTERATPGTTGLPTWLLGLVPLLVLLGAAVLVFTLGVPGLGDRNGVPAEELAIERTVLTPGSDRAHGPQ